MQSGSEAEDQVVADGHGLEGAAEQSFGEADLSWEIACSLLQADSFTSRALEEHVFRMCHSDADPRSTEEYLEDAIDRHRQIVEELEYALDAVDN